MEIYTNPNDFQYSSIGNRDTVAQPGSPLFPELDEQVASDRLKPPDVFSAVDMAAYVTLPTQRVYKLGSLSLVSISSHRDKFPVTGLGSIKIRGITAGHRMIGGSLVFSSYDRNVWYRLIEGAYKEAYAPVTRILPDNLPPFNITITMVNENGTVAITGLLGVSLLDEGETYSMDNIAVMESYSYMAADRIPLQPFEQRKFANKDSVIVDDDHNHFPQSNPTAFQQSNPTAFPPKFFWKKQ